MSITINFVMIISSIMSDIHFEIFQIWVKDKLLASRAMILCPDSISWFVVVSLPPCWCIVDIPCNRYGCIKASQLPVTWCIYVCSYHWEYEINKKFHLIISSHLNNLISPTSLISSHLISTHLTNAHPHCQPARADHPGSDAPSMRSITLAVVPYVHIEFLEQIWKGGDAAWASWNKHK